MIPIPDDQRFVGLSNAFQQTAHYLDSQFLQPNIQEDPRAFGFFMSLVVLRVFAIELALKGLIVKNLGERPEPTHNLMRLFNKLPRPIRDRTDQRFQSIRKAKPSYKGETDALSDVLLLHQNAFTEWRYLDQGGLSVNPSVLNSVLEALWQEHQR